MKTRLLRDFRDLAPFWLLAIAAPAIGYLWPWPAESNPRLAGIVGTRASLTGLGVYFAFHALGVLALSREFDHRTMAFLLSQPIERRALWRERMGLLFVLLLTAFTLDMCIYSRQWVMVWDWFARTWNPAINVYTGKADVPIFYWLTGAPDPHKMPFMMIAGTNPPIPSYLSDMAFGGPQWRTLPGMDWTFGCTLIGAISGFSFGPLTALYLRKSMTAFCAAAIIPVAMFLGVILMAGYMSNMWEVMLTLYVTVIPVLGYVLARRKFMRLEIL